MTIYTWPSVEACVELLKSMSYDDPRRNALKQRLHGFLYGASPQTLSHCRGRDDALDIAASQAQIANRQRAGCAPHTKYGGTTMLSISNERRREIVRRDGGVTKIVVASTKDAEGLTFAIRFLMDHYLYKLSKADGVTADAIRETFSASADAAVSFMQDIAEPHGVDLDESDEPVDMRQQAVSGLGDGTVKNPYDYLS